MRRAMFLKVDKENADWEKKTKAKYPDCVGKKLFEDCPEKVEGDPPSVCRACPQYTPSKEDVRQRMMKLMAEMGK